MMLIDHQNLRHTYGGASSSLAFPDLTVQRGETVGVLGPSGCGKSTWLNLISGLLQPQEGNLSVMGKDFSVIAEADKTRIRGASMGLVTQTLELIPFLTTEQNLLWPRTLCGVAPSQERALLLLEMMGLASSRHSLPGGLSQGEQQRVAVCRALLHEPELLLLDEPTGSLDAATATQVCDVLMAEARRMGAGMIMITHDRSLMERFDHVVEMTR